MTKKYIEIILTQDIQQLGPAGNIVSVKPGYARNYLFPKNFAKFVTPGILKQAKRHQEIENKRQLEIQKTVENTQTMLEKVRKITLKKTTGKSNAIFGTVTDREVAQILSRITQQNIDKKQVQLPEIKTTGVYTLQIKLMKDFYSSIQLQILPRFI